MRENDAKRAMFLEMLNEIGMLFPHHLIENGASIIFHTFNYGKMNKRILYLGNINKYMTVGISVPGIWGFCHFGTSPLNSKSDSNLSPTERSSIRGLQSTSDSLKGPQRASEGLMGSPGAYLFLVFFISSFFSTFLPLVLSPTPF